MITPNATPLSTLFFQVNPERKVSFSVESAWFGQKDFDSLDGLSAGDEVRWHARGIRVRHDTTMSTVQHDLCTLRAGGAMLKKNDGVVIAIQPNLFINRFFRCFSDGTEIASLSEGPQQQAAALAQANTQLRVRIEELLDMSFWKTLIKRKEILAKKENLSLWNKEIEAHIAELRGHTFAEKGPR